jgi:hypothetical protein
VVDANRHFKQPCVFFVTMRHWPLLGQHCLKPGEFDDISVTREENVALLNAQTKGLHRRLNMVEVHGSFWCLPLCTVLHSILLLVSEIVDDPMLYEAITTFHPSPPSSLPIISHL